MACAMVQTNDGWEEELMDGSGLGSRAVCVVTLPLGHWEFGYLCLYLYLYFYIFVFVFVFVFLHICVSNTFIFKLLECPSLAYLQPEGPKSWAKEGQYQRTKVSKNKKN